MNIQTLNIMDKLQDNCDYLACVEQYEHVEWLPAGQSYSLILKNQNNILNCSVPAQLIFIGDIDILNFAQMQLYENAIITTQPLDVLRPHHPLLQQHWNSYIYKLHRLILIASCHSKTKKVFHKVSENDNIIKLRWFIMVYYVSKTV